MTRALMIAAAAMLTGCASHPPLDLCKHAPPRRSVYTTVIVAAGLRML